MAWIPLEDTFHDHPKFRRLAKRLGVPLPHARGCVAGLWSWATRHAPDGDLSDYDADDIAYYSDWDGDAEEFVQACIDAELFDSSGEGLRIHEWRSGSMKRAEQKRKERERKRVARLSRDGRENVGEDKTRQEKKRQDRIEETSLSSSRDREPDLAIVGPEVGQPESSHAGDVRQVFAHYRKHHPRAHPRPVSTSKEWRQISARLREGYSVEDIKRAIDGYHLDPWHCGENDRQRAYLSLELIVRTSSHVQKGIEFAERYANGPPPVLSEREQRGIRAGRQWVERHRQLEEQHGRVVNATE